MTEETRGNIWLVDGRDKTHQAAASYPRAVDVGFVVDIVAVGTVILEVHYYFLFSSLCMGISNYTPAETCVLGYNVLQLFCIYSLCYVSCYLAREVCFVLLH